MIDKNGFISFTPEDIAALLGPILSPPIDSKTGKRSWPQAVLESVLVTSIVGSPDEDPIAFMDNPHNAVSPLDEGLEHQII